MPKRYIFFQSLFSDAIEDPPRRRSAMHSSSSPLLPSHSSWKSVFRLPSASKKHLATVNCTPLDLSPKHASAPPPTLAPSSASLSVDQRSSYNSSTESHSAGTLKSSHLVPDSRGCTPSQHQSQAQLDAAAAQPRPQSRARTKSEKQRIHLNRAPHLPALTSQTPDQFHQPLTLPSPHAPSPSRSGPLSPRAMSASATRFIRRVASAPNAKHLFMSGSRSAAPTKNGLLAPAEVIPPVPGGPSSPSDYGDDSLETLSSGSSRGRSTRHERYPGHGIPKTRIPNPTAEGPGKVAFRRTYSSNSIKVRSVRFLLFLSFSHCISFAQVEVSPSSFLKIKMLGKGDVGRVYLVKEKKTDKLFAMKGKFHLIPLSCSFFTFRFSPFKEGDDRTEED